MYYGVELCREYTRRYGKVHKSQAIIDEIYDAWENETHGDGPSSRGSPGDGVMSITPPPQCMPEIYRRGYVEECIKHVYTPTGRISKSKGVPRTKQVLCLKQMTSADAEDCVSAYRQYYIHEKAYFAKWKKGGIPEWFK